MPVHRKKDRGRQGGTGWKGGPVARDPPGPQDAGAGRERNLYRLAGGLSVGDALEVWPPGRPLAHDAAPSVPPEFSGRRPRHCPPTSHPPPSAFLLLLALPSSLHNS